MFLKVLCFFVILQSVLGLEKFMIKNRKTGEVLCASQKFVKTRPWTHLNSQLWRLEESPTSNYYFIRNVGNGKVLDACPNTKKIVTWRKHGGKNQRWKLDFGDSTKIQVEHYPGFRLVQTGHQPVLINKIQSDDSDRWLLVDPFE